MITFPNCKINLGLHILRKREDGFHDLETIFYPLPIKDALEILRNSKGSPDITFTTTGLLIEGDAEQNLCYRAYELLKNDFPTLPAVNVHLHKNIPMGAGLGGGSSDGAAMLQQLNSQFGLGLTDAQLAVYALQLGSDCAFFLKNKPCFAKGRGELLEPLALDLSQYTFILVNPGIHINTAWAFANIIPRDLRADLPKRSIKEVIQEPISSWKTDLINDFEAPVFDLYPEIQTIKDQLYLKGALYATMTGSGSTVVGIFESQPRLDFPATYTLLSC